MKRRVWSHVVPVEDTWDHYLDGRDCWCEPDYDEENEVVLHYSMDMREFFDVLPRTVH
jgi:hypothetical protein